MTLGGRLVALFPLTHLCLILAQMVLFVKNPNLLNALGIPFWIYIFPVLTFRIHNIFLPLNEGSWDLSLKKYNTWWGTHQFQYLFICAGWLEGLLHTVPGLYTLWLRAWGSKIGKNVFWTPKVEILDRGLVEIGSNVLVGHLAAMSSHMVIFKEGKPILIIKKVRIGDASFIGAVSQLGPGAVVEKGQTLKPKTSLYYKGEYP